MTRDINSLRNEHHVSLVALGTPFRLLRFCFMKCCCYLGCWRNDGTAAVICLWVQRGFGILLIISTRSMVNGAPDEVATRCTTILYPRGIHKFSSCFGGKVFLMYTRHPHPCEHTFLILLVGRFRQLLKDGKILLRLISRHPFINKSISSGDGSFHQ